MTTYDFYKALSEQEIQRDEFGVSQTEPNQSLTPTDIIARYVRGQPVGIAHQTTWELPDEDEDKQFAYQDFTDKFQMMQYVKDVEEKKKKKDKKPDKKPDGDFSGKQSSNQVEDKKAPD